LSQPFLTEVRGLDSDGVLLLRTSDPAARGAVPTPQSEQEDALLRYAVVLTNTTSHPIIAYYVHWKFTDSGGTVRHGLVKDKSFPGGNPIAPHSAKLLSLDNGIGAGAFGFSQRSQDRMDQRLRFYHEQRGIEASLELVVLDDGTAVGPDSEGWLPHFRAWMDAERDFVHTVLAENSVMSFRQRVLDAREQGFDALPKDAPKSLTRLGGLGDWERDYSRCYQLATGFFAVQVAEWIDQTGEDAAKRRLLLITGSKHYPELRRKGQ